MQIKPTSHIEISRSAYKNNLQYLRQKIDSKVRISSVIKGYAYGHGVQHLVPMAEEMGIDHFSVFSASEAHEAFQIKSPASTLMIMGMMNDDHELEWAVANGVEFFVFDEERLEKAISLARRLGKQALVHLELETGFHRTGMEYDSVPQVAKLLNSNRDHLDIVGICTHYAGAESVANYYRVIHQIKRYHQFCQHFAEHGVTPRIHHTACSAAALSYPETCMDMVRIGIAQYGFWPSQETNMLVHKEDLESGRTLERMISWKSKVMAVKSVPPGEFIGYGTSYLANRRMAVAIVPVGYANGFTRSLSNNGRVLIHGRRLAVVGVVTMNTMAVDVTDLPKVKKGDDVVIIGKQKKRSISVASFSELSNQLNYQVLARLPRDIPRTLVK